jgi:hypothetical protein
VHPKGRAIRKSFGFVGNTVYQLDRLGYGNHESIRHRTLYLCDYDPLDVFTWAVMIARASTDANPFKSHTSLSAPLRRWEMPLKQF